MFKKNRMLIHIKILINGYALNPWGSYISIGIIDLCIVIDVIMLVYIVSHMLDFM